MKLEEFLRMMFVLKKFLCFSKKWWVKNIKNSEMSNKYYET